VKELVTKYPDGLTRCYWPKQEQIYIDYHDTEWGVAVTDENALFEAIALEGFQAGLSWITILKRREGFRKAFLDFEISRVAKMNSKQVERLMKDEAIIRNRAKIVATINNAKLALSLDRTLEDIIWSHAPRPSKRTTPAKNFEFRAVSEESQALSKTLRSLGFAFVGPTTMYAMMQSIGMINDHAPGCFRRGELEH
jgi:DNA-3-methyladenine glycosylase I